MRVNFKKGLAIILMTIATLGITTTAAAAEETTDGEVGPTAYWRCWGDNRYDAAKNVRAGCTDENTNAYNKFEAHFVSYGEWLYIEDKWDNGSPTVVYLTVDGSGTAIFESRVDARSSFNLSYSEGKDVTLKVCSSFSSNRKCTTQSTGTT